MLPTNEAMIADAAKKAANAFDRLVTVVEKAFALLEARLQREDGDAVENARIKR